MSWQAVPLGELAEFLNGGTPSKAKTAYFKGDIPWITGADIVDSEVSRARSHITEEAIRASATNLVPPGTVLLVTRTSVGKVAVAAEPLCFSQDITAIRPNPDRLDTRYLVHFLKTQQRRFERASRGATIKGITREAIASLKVPLPPIHEQRRIAAILDQAEELRAKRRAAIALLDQLPQAIFIEMFGDPATNPKHWPLQTLGSSTDFIRNGKSVKQSRDMGGLPITRIETISMGEVNPDRCGYAGLHEAECKPFLLKVHDILFSHINSFEHVGKTAMYQGKPERLVHGMNLLCIRPKNGVVTGAFLLHFLRQPSFRHLLEPFINKAVNQASVSSTNLKSIRLPVPPIELQQRFELRVGTIYRAKESHEKALAELYDIFASLQQKLFGKGALL